MGLGALGTCGGIVMALSQRDVKRVLAYSTVENSGIVTLAIGAAFMAASQGQAVGAALAWTAALLHIWNHAVSKSLLFFSGGAIAEVTGSRDLESWGGLWRRLPVLGTAFLIGAAALIGLPGTHGFASEWFLFMGLVTGCQELTGVARLAMLAGIVALAFTAGTALGCFVRLVGVGLLGHPRSPGAGSAAEPRSLLLWLPVLALAAMCIGLTGLLIPLLTLLAPAVSSLAPAAGVSRVIELAAPLPWLAAALASGAVLVILGRRWIDRTRTVRWAVTWGCGFARPTATMQYTATSLAEPVTRVFRPLLRTLVRWTPPRGLWPAALSWEAETPERTMVELYRPAFHRLVHALGFLTRLQGGRVMVYLRYVAIALLVLLLWLFVPAGSLP
jgi:NADH:ubiquinone oxidoreductase subunit 5 (subunit L)/multisubunit Na+/H+ antiporter MnhA subunit